MHFNLELNIIEKVVRFLIIFFVLLLCETSMAQELSIKDFREATNDLAARTKPRQDNNGNDCALVKVQLAAPNATFTGNVMGNISFKNNEYWVYMTTGSKRLKVTHPSYLPLEVSFGDYGINQLSGKSTYVLTLLLGDLPQGVQPHKVQTGWILLNSEPQGASVFINDEFVGNTPLDGYKQPYGIYSYRVEHPNYHPSSGTIELNTGRLEKMITLQPAFGAITVKCNIDGATVILDGKTTGLKTPCTLKEVASGQHTVTVQKEKYAPRQNSVVVEDGQTANIDISLDARFATISITSLEGAQIFCNGKQIGTMRVEEDMMEGYYDIEARLSHYKSVTKQIRVVAGQSQQITLNPIPIYGSLDIISTPRDADITIDGKSYGKTPFTIEQLLEGEHIVVLKKDGFSTESSSVIIHENEDVIINVELKERKNETIYLKEGESLQSKLNVIAWPMTQLKIVGQIDLSDQDWELLKTLCKSGKFKSLDIQELVGVTEIPKEAFKGCTGLTSIYIPNSVTRIGNYAFQGCSKLTSVHITDIAAWCNINFDLNSNPLSYANHLYLNGNEVKDLVIPNSVTIISDFAFMGCLGLTSVCIPNSVTKIGLNPFSGCSNLSLLSVEKGNRYYDSRENCNAVIETNSNRLICGCKTTMIPNSVTEIYSYAYMHQRNLTSVNIPNSVTVIQNYAFYGCSGLSSIDIPYSVRTIAGWAFMYCSRLTSVNIPESVTTIGEMAFWGCSKLLSASIPNGTKIHTNAFNGCPKLKIMRR